MNIEGHQDLPGTDAPEGPDAITRATSDTNNTHTFAVKLKDKLTEQNMIVRIIDYTEAKGQTFGDNVVIFAGPTWGGKLIEQIPNLMNEITIKSKSLCTSLTACGTQSSGDEAVSHMVQQLADKGFHTLSGIALDADLKPGAVDRILTDFAIKIGEELK
ncbi:MAG: hypothetical protein R6V04_14050 [bacterium]